MALNHYNGDDLLAVFDKLKIQTGNLNPNIIRAWFDTDSVEMRNLLNWMCSSLTEANSVSPLENLEFSELKEVLEGDDLDRAIVATDAKFPGLFRYESSLFHIEIAQDELETAKEQLAGCNDEMEDFGQMVLNMTEEQSNVTKEIIQGSVKCKVEQEECLELAEELDATNEKLHDQITKYAQYLCDFEFDAAPWFLNNMDHGELEEKLNRIAVHVIGVLKRENQSLEETTNNTVSMNGALTDIRNRLFHSQMSCLSHRMEIEKLNAALNFLQNSNADSILSVYNCNPIQLSIDSKKEQQALMFDMIENASARLADHHVDQLKLKYAQDDLKASQSRLNDLNNLAKSFIKVLSNFLVMNILTLQEKSDIDNSDEFFKSVYDYISQELQKRAIRTEYMTKVINEFEEFKTKGIEHQFTLVREIGKYVGGTTFAEIQQSAASLRSDIDDLEKKIYVDEIRGFKEDAKQMYTNISVLKNFLTCGPTIRLVAIPRPLQNMMNEVDTCLRAQDSSVRAGVQIRNKTLKTLSEDKWLRNRRQLWMHFMNNDPKKLFAAIEQIEDEFKRRQIKM